MVTTGLGKEKLIEQNHRKSNDKLIKKTRETLERIRKTKKNTRNAKEKQQNNLTK